MFEGRQVFRFCFVLKTSHPHPDHQRTSLLQRTHPIEAAQEKLDSEQQIMTSFRSLGIRFRCHNDEDKIEYQHDIFKKKSLRLHDAPFCVALSPS